MYKQIKRLTGRYTFIPLQLAKITSETFVIPQEFCYYTRWLTMCDGDGEGECNSEMNPDERQRRETLNDIISTVEKDSTSDVDRLTVLLCKIMLLDLVTNNSHVGFVWTKHFANTFLLCKHFFAFINYEMAKFNDWSQSFSSTHFMALITTKFTIIVFMTLTILIKKYIT